MAYVSDGKHFGQYTYEHWFDHEYGNKNNVIIGELTVDEIEFVANMVDNIFDELVGKDYFVEGNNIFKAHIKPQNILSRFVDKSSQFFTIEADNEIIGMMEIKNKDHISLFFVKKEFHGHGIGKNLFGHYLNKIANENTGIKKVTVNIHQFVQKKYILNLALQKQTKCKKKAE
jgi:GNAT superfamily N-acetyltransferase